MNDTASDIPNPQPRLTGAPATGAFDPVTRTLSLSQRDRAFFGDPYPAYAAFHERGPVFFWSDIGHWAFAGYDMVNALLRDRRFGRQILHVASREELRMGEPEAHRAAFDATEAHSLLELEPPAHTRLRALVNRAFVSRQVEAMRPDVARLAGALVDGFAKDGSVELLSAFGEIIPVTIIARMLGVPEGDAPRLLAWSHSMVRMYVFGHSHEDEVEANAAAAAFTDYLLDHIATRRARPCDDLLSRMASAEIDGERLTDDELVSTAILLLNAGHEATVHQIGNAVKTILESGLSPASLFADAEATRLTVEECLRYDGPLHLFMRYALTDIEIEGVSLKKGERIALILGAANRDPKAFDAPALFRPDRQGPPHLAFGAGLHFCLGAPLARLELHVALPILFERLPGLRLAGAPTYRDSYHFHGLERLDLAW